MEHPNNAALVSTCKPQFFKILSPDPFENLMIPRKFHVNLPRKPQKLATLFSPAGKFWHVETCRTGKDKYFQKGWSEFAKAHDLQTGYLMVFKYEGNMIFKVKIFDTIGCLKDYSPAIHARQASAYIEIEGSSEIGDETPSNRSHESKSDIVKDKSNILKKRKLADGQALEIDETKRGPTSQETLKEMKDLKEENVNSNISSRQFEIILKPYCFSRSFICIPKAFCVNNGLLTRRTIHLKDNSSGKSWPINLTSGGCLHKGWKKFREAARLKEGDRCIFRLVSDNSLVVTAIPRENKSPRKRKGKGIEGSTSSVVALEEKQIQQNKHFPRPILECESTPLGKTFCLDNNLTSPRDVTLRDLTGKEWHANFNINEREGRSSRTGWTNSREYGLNVGDKCIFKLIQEDTLLVHVVKKNEQPCELIQQ